MKAITTGAAICIVVTSILAFSSPSLAASDEEIAHSGDLMSTAFECLTYARMSHDYKEEDRLFLIGLKAGRDFYEGIKSRNDPALGEVLIEFLRKTSTDFMVGLTYDNETKEARDKIVKYDDGRLREPSQWLDPPEAKLEAERSYRKSNCSLIK